MLGLIKLIINRIRALRHTRLDGVDALLLFHSNVTFILEPGSEIVIKRGQLRLGYPLPGATPYASYPQTVIQLCRGAKWISEGPVAIAPGATIRVGPNAVLKMGGDNLIAHNLTLLCAKDVALGRGTHLSWNVTLIDDDGHRFVTPTGKPFRKIGRPLRIGEQVAIQMNVQIPSAVAIGDRAVIAAGTVLRRDVPAECTAYQDTQLRLKEGFLPTQRPGSTHTPHPELAT